MPNQSTIWGFLHLDYFNIPTFRLNSYYFMEKMWSVEFSVIIGSL